MNTLLPPKNVLPSENFLLTNGLNVNSRTCIALKDKYPEYVDIFNILFSNTLYLTLDNVITSLETQINNFIENKKDYPVVVLIGTDKIGSEQYFYYKLQDKLPPHYIFFSNHTLNSDKILKEITEPTYLLFMDDWSLSGNNMVATFDYTLSNSSYINNNGKRVNQLKNPNILPVIITAIKSNEAVSLLKKTLKRTDIDVYSEYTVNNLWYYISKDPVLSKNINLLNNFSKQLTPQYRGGVYGYPAHLSYKIANDAGSFPAIYGECREISPNKEFMKEAKTIYDNNIAINTTAYNASPTPKKIKTQSNTSNCDKSNGCIIAGKSKKTNRFKLSRIATQTFKRNKHNRQLK